MKAKKNKVKKRVIILSIVCLVILIGGFITDRMISNKYLVELKYNDVIKKLDNKENFVLCITQTTCPHCSEYKPKLRKVARKYDLVAYYIEVDLLNDEEMKDFLSHINYDVTPTTVFIKNGEEKTMSTRIKGDTGEEKIINKFKSNGFID